MHVLVCGIGLMGGSLAAAATAAGWRVSLWHRRPGPAEEAARRGWGQVVASPEAAADADVAVVCTPVSTIPDLVRRLAVSTRAVVTDVGSAKGGLVSALAAEDAGGRFVGSHPMCGSHATGLDHAEAGLYRGRVVITTPTAATPIAARDRVEALWSAVGARLVRLSPDEHDRAVAVASHLPHILASAAAAPLTTAAAPLCAGGFRDTTRVAAGDPSLWADILTANRAEIVPQLLAARDRLDALATALAADDRAAVEAWLALGRAGRERFETHAAGCVRPA
jgi:prephenate dehydrogenase